MSYYSYVKCYFRFGNLTNSDNVTPLCGARGRAPRCRCVADLKSHCTPVVQGNGAVQSIKILNCKQVIGRKGRCVGGGYSCSSRSWDLLHTYRNDRHKDI